MENLKVSIIMGIYNCEETLSKSIESMINQTYTNWEFIICDDGSIDSSYKIAKEYSDKDERIIVMKNDRNMGLAYTLNRCIEVSNGEYIARQDGDDYSDINRLEKQVEFLEKNMAYGFVSTAVHLFDENGVWGERYNIENPSIQDLVKKNQFCHPSTLIRKELINKVDNYTVSKETYRAEDYDLWFKLYINGVKGYNMQDKLHYFREDKSSYSRKKYKYRVDVFKLKLHLYRKSKLPYRYYIYAIRPLLVGIIPKHILQKYHRSN